MHGLRRGKKPKPRWERKFPTRQSRYEARILEPPSELDESIEVLIAETDVQGNQRMLIWDVKEGTVRNQLMIPAEKETKLIKTQSQSQPREREGDESMNDTESDPDAESYKVNIIEAAHPKFCISKNKQWLGTFSRRFQSCSIASVTSRATVWTFGFPKCFQSAPYNMPTEAMFDPNGDHFLILDECAIIVCAPEFLDDKAHAEKTDQTFNKAYACLPSRSLASALEDRAHNYGVQYWITEISPDIDDGCSISDATLSGDGKTLAFIASDPETSSQPIRSSRIVCCEEYNDRVLLDLAFNDAGTEVDSKSFICSRLFLYENDNGPDQGLVAFSLLKKPMMAMFIDMQTENMREKELENVDRCL